LRGKKKHAYDPKGGKGRGMGDRRLRVTAGRRGGVEGLELLIRGLILLLYKQRAGGGKNEKAVHNAP